jgi:hypothetical protein
MAFLVWITCIKKGEIGGTCSTSGKEGVNRSCGKSPLKRRGSFEMKNTENMLWRHKPDCTLSGKVSFNSEHNRSEMVAVLWPYEALPYYKALIVIVSTEGWMCLVENWDLLKVKWRNSCSCIVGSFGGSFHSVMLEQLAYHSGRAVQGMNCLRSLKHWGRGFETHSRHGCLCAFILCLCCTTYR